MNSARIILVMLGVAAAAFAAGWAFRAYLAPDAVVDFANRIFFCQ